MVNFASICGVRSRAASNRINSVLPATFRISGHLL